MEDFRQNPVWMEYCKKKGIEPIKIPSKNESVFIWGTLYKLAFGFKLLKIQRNVFIPKWDELKKIQKKYRVLSTIIEPQKVSLTEYKKSGYKLSNFPYLATKTVIIDLRNEVDNLWNKLSENAKRLIKKNKSLLIKEVSPEEFLRIWKTCNKIWTLSSGDLRRIKKTLGKRSKFLMSYIDGEPQSGILLVETKNVANYYHSFTTAKGRESGAHYKLVWEVLLMEKRNSKSFFDFEGIFDSRWPQKKWLGFSEFKKKFGGEVIKFPGCFHKWLW